MAETDLELEQRHMRRTEELIVRQEQRIERLLAIGDNRTLALAQAVLAGLHQSLRLGRERIAHLERKYASQARHRKSAEG